MGVVWAKGGHIVLEESKLVLNPKNGGGFGRALGWIWKPFAMEKMMGLGGGFRKLRVSDFKNYSIFIYVMQFITFLFLPCPNQFANHM